MSVAKITLYSFAHWMHLNNDDLFSGITLPEGIDKDTLIENILLRGGEFEVVYSDPNFMQYAIGSWSRKWYRTFLKWITALNIDYNPLENYDRFEDWTDTGDKGNDMTRTLNNKDKRTLNTEDKETRNISDATVYNSTMTSTKQVSAFDSSTYQPSEQDTDLHTGTDTTNGTGTDTFNHTGSDTMDHSGTINDKGIENTKDIHTGRIHGNIGVTTSQQMLQSELDLALWNIYEHITDLFLTEFIIPIYT